MTSSPATPASLSEFQKKAQEFIAKYGANYTPTLKHISTACTNAMTIFSLDPADADQQMVDEFSSVVHGMMRSWNSIETNLATAEHAQTLQKENIWKQLITIQSVQDQLQTKVLSKTASN